MVKVHPYMDILENNPALQRNTRKETERDKLKNGG